ncbi:MAG: hypothetical protein V1799_04050 [bacterium]
MNTIVKIFLDSASASEIMQLSRQIATDLLSRNLCNSLIPVNRANEGRIDCYLFGSVMPADELKAIFDARLYLQCKVEFIEDSPELEMVKCAAHVSTALFQNYSPDLRIQKLFSEHVHYIFNTLGYDKLDEAQSFLMQYSQITMNLISLALTRAR